MRDRKSYNKALFKADYRRLRLILKLDNLKDLKRKWEDYEFWLYSDEANGKRNPVEEALANGYTDNVYIWKTRPELSNIWSQNWLDWVKER